MRGKKFKKSKIIFSKDTSEKRRISYKIGEVLVDKNVFEQEKQWGRKKRENVTYAEYLEISPIVKSSATNYSSDP